MIKKKESNLLYLYKNCLELNNLMLYHRVYIIYIIMVMCCKCIILLCCLFFEHTYSTIHLHFR